MRINTEGIILKEQNIREKDKLVFVLTKHNGLVRAFVHGAKNIKNRKNSATGLLCYSKISLYSSKDAYIIDEAEPIEVFFDLRNNLENLALAQYFSELAMSMVHEGEDNPEYLRLILNCLFFLANGKLPRDQVKAIFELRIMCIAGYMPNLVACNVCGEYETKNMYMDLSEGVLYCENCAPPSAMIELDTGLVSALRHIAFSDFDRIFSFKMADTALPELSFITERYLLSTLERNFNTLEFYKDLIKNEQT